MSAEVARDDKCLRLNGESRHIASVSRGQKLWYVQMRGGYCMRRCLCPKTRSAGVMAAFLS